MEFTGPPKVDRSYSANEMESRGQLLASAFEGAASTKLLTARLGFGGP
jgi:hypothetical protein